MEMTQVEIMGEKKYKFIFESGRFLLLKENDYKELCQYYGWKQ